MSGAGPGKRDRQRGDELARPNQGDAPGNEIVPKQVQERVQQMLGVQISHGRDQFIEKLDGQHISTILQNADKSDSRDHLSKRIGLCAAGILLFAMCWLFLFYGKSEHLDAVIAGVIGLAGGYGIGRSTKGE